MPIQRRRLTEDRGRRWPARSGARECRRKCRRGARGARPAGSGWLGAAANTRPAQSGRFDAARPAAAAAATPAAAATATSGSGSGPAAATAAAAATSAAAATAAAADRGGGAGSGWELAPAREVGGPRPCRCGARMHYGIYTRCITVRHSACTLHRHCACACTAHGARPCPCVAATVDATSHPAAHPMPTTPRTQTRTPTRTPPRAGASAGATHRSGWADGAGARPAAQRACRAHRRAGIAEGLDCTGCAYTTAPCKVPDRVHPLSPLVAARD